MHDRAQNTCLIVTCFLTWIVSWGTESPMTALSTSSRGVFISCVLHKPNVFPKIRTAYNPQRMVYRPYTDTCQIGKISDSESIRMRTWHGLPMYRRCKACTSTWLIESLRNAIHVHIIKKKNNGRFQSCFNTHCMVTICGSLSMFWAILTFSHSQVCSWSTCTLISCTNRWNWSNNGTAVHAQRKFSLTSCIVGSSIAIDSGSPCDSNVASWGGMCMDCRKQHTSQKGSCSST